MAIASNIFKQLIYVPEVDDNINTPVMDSVTTFDGTSIVVKAGSPVSKGDDEVTVSYTAGSNNIMNKGATIVFAGSPVTYYVAETASGAATSLTFKLDRPFAGIGTAGADATAGTGITYSYAVAGPGTNKPKKLRRVSSNLSAKFETYSSNEIRSDQQVSDSRNGGRTVDGTISGELSSKTYEPFFAALLRKNFYSPVEQTAVGNVSLAIGTAGTPANGMTCVNTIGTTKLYSSNLTPANVAVLTFAAGDANASTVDAGTDTTAGRAFTGIRVGDVLTLTTATGLTAPSVSGTPALSVPLLVIDKDASTYKITVVGAADPSSVTFTAGTASVFKFEVLGKKSFIPLNGHVQKSFQFEHFYSDLTTSNGALASELFTGCRVTQGSVKLPTSGITTCDFNVMGIGSITPAQSATVYKTGGSVIPGGGWATTPMLQQLTEETPIDSAIDSVYSSAVGNIYFRDKKTGYNIYKADAVTAFDITMNSNGATLKVVGSQTSPDVTIGKLNVNGNFSTYFKDNTLYNAFVNEDELSIISYFSENASNSIDNAFMTFVLPRVKLGSASKDDAQSIVMTSSFNALVSDGSNGFEATTIQIQDYAQLA